MGFNPFETAGYAAAATGDFIQKKGGEAAKALVGGAGAVAVAAGDAASVVADGASKAASFGAEQISNVIGATKSNNNDSQSEAPVDEESAGKVLDTIYESALNGIPKVSRSVDEMVNDYMSKAETPEEAAKALAKWQIAKCGTSGFVTGLGGLITLPVAIPANIGSVMYVQMRMIACIAKMGGYDLKSDQVQTMVYMCLTGTTVADVMKQAGIKTGMKTLEATIKKIPGTVLAKINQKMGFRFITKFGEKGVINLGKMVPVAGGIIGGSVDMISTATIAKNAISMFIKGQDFDGSTLNEDKLIEVQPIDLEDESGLI